MNATGKTHAGLVRPNNEDTLLLLEGEHMLLGVADGMGGHSAGEVASRMAVELLPELLADSVPTASFLREAMEEVNRKLYEAQSSDPSLTGMGTTLTVLWPSKDRVVVGHVGDSRAYLLRQGRLFQVTEDHSVVAGMVRAKLLTNAQARRHPYRNIITRSVGTEETVLPDVLTLDVRPGDRWLVCSDGLINEVEDSDIGRILKDQNPDEAVDSLINAALKAGGHDNITVAVLEAGV